MKTYEVKFKKMFDAEGNGTDYPTDSLQTRIDCSPDFQEMIPPAVLPGQGTEIWKYQVEDADADYFEQCLDRASDVASYRELHEVA